MASAFGPAAVGPAYAAGDARNAELPYVIQPELGAAEFAAGDAIAIDSLRGDRKRLEPGGRYLVTGTYTLASAENADLAWFCTTRGPGESVPIAPDEHVKVSRGSGRFQLQKTLLSDGWLHVSFYVDDQPHGGVYFGEKGLERTVLRRKSWSDFSNGAPTQRADRKAAPGTAAAPRRAEAANAAIMAYLGDPVPAPADLDAKYAPTNLVAVFTALGKKAGWTIQKLAVDDLEFPFLLYGRIAGKHEYREIQDGLREMKGFEYGGSVVGTTDDPSTYFALNIIPYDQYRGERMAACHRRLMVRLQMLASSVQQSK